ncbi:MAG TPA: hypothetical protein VEO02_14890 [Thermoanaerobaculia bacterium]|nr:hypothetical protein [Thermoanaerobaculia bacterium]
MVHTRRIAILAGLLLFGLLRPLASHPSSLSISPLAGLSGKLRAFFALPGEPVTEGKASRRIPLVPFSAKVNGRIGSYRLGDWPYERRQPSSPLYANPKGFVEVTPENFSTHLSEHFTLGQFITKDQLSVWPKYVVLQPRLLDKLELTIEELRREGHPVGLFVMSGFRTPEYNEQGVGAGGRSAVSRHQYGDAADVYPDDHGKGWMNDLNGDGRVDLKDARILASAAEAVEREHPELAGGIGIYPATGAHGPFVHIDARGTRARWGG